MVKFEFITPDFFWLISTIWFFTFIRIIGVRHLLQQLVTTLRAVWRLLTFDLPHNPLNKAILVEQMVASSFDNSSLFFIVFKANGAHVVVLVLFIGLINIILIQYFISRFLILKMLFVGARNSLHVEYSLKLSFLPYLWRHLPSLGPSPIWVRGILIGSLYLHLPTRPKITWWSWLLLLLVSIQQSSSRTNLRIFFGES